MENILYCIDKWLQNVVYLTSLQYEMEETLMKKLFAILLALTLCVGALSVVSFAADYQFVSVTGTMNDWNTGAESGKMTEISDNVYSLTIQNMAAGEHKFKFTANGNWDDLNLGGAFMGSAVEADLYWSGADIVINIAEACDVTIRLDLTGFDAASKTGAKFTVTIGDQVDAPRGDIKIHISVPEGWGDVYAYVWGPEHLGSWPGTKVENGTVELPAAFDGFIVNNNAGTQTSDIKDIDLTKEEVWLTVTASGYSLSYADPNGSEEPAPDPEPTPDPEPIANIKVHVIVPDSWNEVYAYTYNPEQCGIWPGTKVENGQLEVAAAFEGFILNNNAGSQTGDIKDIDLTKEEVWIVVGDDNSYALYYNESDIVIPEPTPTIKIHVIAPESWSEVYAYTFNPAQCGNWPGALVENGYIEIPASFEGFIVNNNNGAQTADIKDIDLTCAEVWVIVNEDCSYTLSYEAPQAPEESKPAETDPIPTESKPVEPNPDDGPSTGDVISIVVALMAVSGLALVIVKKRHY